MKRTTSRFRGSILASVLMLSFMYLTIFTFTTRRYQQQQTLVSDSIKYHKIETLEHLVQYYLENEHPTHNGILKYSTGQVAYKKIDEKTFSLDIRLTTGEKKVCQVVIRSGGEVSAE